MRRFATAFQASVHLFLAGLVLAVVAGCGALGQQASQSPEDTLQYAKATLAGTYRTVGDAVAGGTLPSAQARLIEAKLNPVAQSLAEAEALLSTGVSTDTSTGMGKVNAALLVLTEVKNILLTYSAPVAKPVVKPVAPAASAA